MAITGSSSMMSTSAAAEVCRWSRASARARRRHFRGEPHDARRPGHRDLFQRRQQQQLPLHLLQSTHRERAGVGR